METLEEIACRVKICKSCILYRGRTQAVPGDGSAKATLMFVGEAPGVSEDREGLPFVGAAGKLLSELLGGIGLCREEVFITNVVKCRPPGNRDPREEEIEKCLPFLRRQVALIRPALICSLGNHALRTLVDGSLSITQAHGRFFEKDGFTFYATYHPAAALYNQRLRSVLEKDFARLGERLRRIVTSCNRLLAKIHRLI